MDGWEAIRDLDEEENWVERNRVLSRADHLHLVESAKEIVDDLVQNLPISSPPKPVTTTYELTDDDFQYSAAQFDVDYLEGISSDANADPSALSRKSLFVKFDPLMSQTSLSKAPRGRVPLGDNTHLSNIAQMEGDLLMLSTPPPHTHKHGGVNNHIDVVKSLDAVTLSNHVDGETLVNCNTVNPLPSTDSSSQSPRSSSVSSTPVASHSHSSITQRPAPTPGLASSQASSSPLTDNLVEVLKYSEHNLPEILESARRQQREIETAKYEDQMRELKERIEKSRKQALHKNKRKDNLQSRGVHILAAIWSTEEQINTLKEKVALQSEKEVELRSKHEEFRKKVRELEEQLELVTKDSTALENCFDDLHHLYMRLKGVHQKLATGNKILTQHLDELQAWKNEDDDNYTLLHREMQEMEQRAEERFESMRQEQKKKTELEKTRNHKLLVEYQSLQAAYKLKVEEKDAAAKICEELMQVCETYQQNPVDT